MASIRKRTWTTARGEAKTAWAVDFVDQAGTRQRRQFPTKRAADAFRIEIEGQLKAGTYRQEASKLTVKDACESYLEHCKGRMERRERMTRANYVVYRGHVNNHILHPGHGVGALKLAQLTARGVGEFRDRLRNAGVTVPTTRKILATLHAMLEYAISQDWIALNTAHGVKVIGRRDEGPKKIIPPSKEAMKALIGVAGPDLKVKLIFASATGVRAGEFHALRWRHLDLVKGEVTVETRVDIYGDEDITKTPAGMRTVPLGQAVVSVLKAWRLRSKFSKPDDLVFPSCRGTYQDHGHMLKREFNPLFAKLAKIHAESPDQTPQVTKFNWHALRHFAVSCWIESGLLPKTVQTFAGHSSLQVTMDRYGHLFKSKDHKKAMDQIAKGLFA